MKKVILPVIAIVFFLLPQQVFAQELCPASFASLCKLRLENGGGLVGAIISLILIIAIMASLVFLVVGAIRWISSGGDEAKVKAARSTIVAAIVGLVISLLSFFITSTIVSVFTGQGLEGLKVPRLIDK